MDFRILGPLEVEADEGLVSIAPGQRRAVLIDLLLHANDVVSDERLVDDLWGETPPPSAQKIIQLHIANLRRAVGGYRIRRVSPGYQLQLGPGELDAASAREAAELAATVEPPEQVELLEAALREWRGRPLIDVEYDAFARNEIDQLEELRFGILERLYAARLELGQHAEVVAGLESLVGAQPLRERPRALLMIALYRSGRQAEALDRYRTARALFANELGLEPGPELQRLERQVLEHDPALSPPLTRRLRRPSRRGRTLVLLMGVAGIAAAVVGGLLLFRGATPIRPAANMVLAVDPQGRYTRAVAVGSTPVAIATSAHTLWVANFSDSTVTRLDLRDGRASTVGTPAAPTSLALGAASTWVASRFTTTLVKLNSATAGIDATVNLQHPADGITFAASALWAVNEQAGTLTRIDPKTLHAKVVRTGLAGPSAVTAVGDTIWIAASFSKRLLRYDPQSRTITSLQLTLTPDQIAEGCGALWLTDPADNEVTAIDEHSLQPRLIAVGTNPTTVSVAAGHAWVINDLSHSADEINCATGAVVKTLVFGSNKPGSPKLTPKGVSVASDGTAWIALQSF